MGSARGLAAVKPLLLSDARETAYASFASTDYVSPSERKSWVQRMRTLSDVRRPESAQAA